MTKKAAKEMAFPDAIGSLSASALPSAAALRALSDLDGDKLQTWRDTWNALPGERRIALIERLREQAEEDLEVNYSALFRHALNDPVERVRLSAIEGLYEDEQPTLIDPLISLSRDDASETVRAAAADSLGRFVQLGEMDKITQTRRDQVYAALMRALLTSPQDSLLHRRALEALAFVSNEEMDLQIQDAYNAPDDLLRLSAIVAMGRSQNRIHRATVRGELHSLSPAVRREAARASGALEDEEAVPDLAQLLEDTSMDVRFAALDALAEIGGKDARDLVEAATQSDDDEFAAHAAEALEELDFFHGDIDFSLALFDADEQKPTKVVKPRKTDEAE